MKVKIIGILFLIFMSLSLLGCQEIFVDEDTAKESGTNIDNPVVYSVSYDDDDRESIFGELNTEEIRNIIDKLLIELEDDSAEIYKIIEEVFIQSGIDNPKQIEAAKTKLVFSGLE